MKATSRDKEQASHDSDNGRGGSQELRLTAQIEKQLVRDNQPSSLKLSVRNDTSNVLFLIETYAERDFKFDVRDENGEIVPFTKDGENLVKNDAIYRQVAIKMSPGDEVHYNVTINKIFDMSRPGTYSVTVRRKVVWSDAKLFAEIESNPVEVRVIE